MKKIYTILVILLMCAVTFSQSPEAFSYQAVLRNSNGEPMGNKNVTIHVALFQGKLSGNKIFSETHSTTTNEFGLITLQVGSEKSKAFLRINWANGPYYIQILVDGVEMGTTQLLSVPYALYAKTAENTFSGDYNDLKNKPTESNHIWVKNGDIISPGPGNKLEVNGTIKGFSTDATTENGGQIQSWAEGTSQGQKAIYSFYPTFEQTGDNGPRRAADLVSGFDNEAWGHEYMSFHVGNNSEPNDNQLLTNEKMRINGEGNVGIGITKPEEKLEVDGMVYSHAGGYKFPDGTVQISAATSGGGGADADADPENELQTLSIDGNKISISNGNTINLPAGTVDEDSDPENEIQILSLNGNKISISGGNSVTLPTSEVDLDADPTNEIQNISLNGSKLSITNGSTVDLSTIKDGYEPNTDKQTLSISGNSLSISNGNSVTLPSGTGGSSLWTQNASDIFYNQGKVGIKTSSPKALLSVGGNGSTNTSIYGESDKENGVGVYGYASYQGYIIHNVRNNESLDNSDLLKSTSTSISNIGNINPSDPGIGIDLHLSNLGGCFISEGPYGIGAKGIGKTGLFGIGYEYGVRGKSNEEDGVGILGTAENTLGTNYGGQFKSAGANGYGIYCEAQDTNDNINYGGYFVAKGKRGVGIYGIAENPSRFVNFGGKFYAKGRNGTGIQSEGTHFGGVFVSTWQGDEGDGVYAVSNSVKGRAVYAEAKGTNGTAVCGYASHYTGTNTSYGGFFRSDGPKGIGIYGKGKLYAAKLEGKVKITDDVYVDGNVSCHSITGAVKWFKIDHPLDPENKNLSHASIETDQFMNLYSGNVVLNKNGEAWVEFPDWFQALNKDFTYQLTCIGGYANVYVENEIENNKFKIAGGREGLKVSWQVTGIRHDKYAKENPIQVETSKEQ